MMRLGTRMDETTNTASHDKLLEILLRVVSISAVVLFGILAIFKIFAPSGRGGWSTLPFVDYLLIIGLLVSLVCYAAILTYQSWTKGVDEYFEWLTGLGFFRGPAGNLFQGLYPKWCYCWTARILAPFGAIVLSTIIVFLIVVASGFLPRPWE